MASAFAWLFRGEEKRRAYARLGALRESYGEYGSLIIKLSERTELARRTAGATRSSFEYVEQAFLAASTEFVRVGELIDPIEAGLAKGTIGDFPAAEAAVKGLGPKFDAVSQHLARWEAQWDEAPRQLAEAEHDLRDLIEQLEAGSADLPGPLPTLRKAAGMGAHLEKSRATLAAGNPAEALHLVEDFRLALGKVRSEAESYLSGARAVRQVEADLLQLREQAGPAAPAEITAALAAAGALLPRLRPALSDGRLDPLQKDLLEVQRQLSHARALLRAAPPRP